MERELAFRIILEKPPAGVDFGLQKGRSNECEIMQKQRSGKGDLRFEFTARVRPGTRGEEPNLLGPFVQGPKGERFVYVNIGVCAGQLDSKWSRRLKVPLGGISGEVVDRIGENSKAIFETRVPGTGKDGGPNCATVKPFGGWKLVKP